MTRHVDRVPDGTWGPFHCLECNEALLYRQSRRARTHFAHRPDTKCTGETALHLYAKALLAQVREFTFTPLVLSQAGLQEVVFEGGRFQLDVVAVEADQFSFRPDATVMVAGQAFAIEFKVSHAVTEEKQSKVAASASLSCYQGHRLAARHRAWPGPDPQERLSQSEPVPLRCQRLSRSIPRINRCLSVG